MPPKLDQRRRKTNLRPMNDSDLSQIFVDDSPNVKRLKTLPSSTTTGTSTTTAIMSAPKSEVATIATGERTDPNAPDEATRALFGAFEVHTTPANAPTPLFKIDEPVFFIGVKISGGGTIAAVAWTNEYHSYVYKVGQDDSSHDLYRLAFLEDHVRCSLWTVGDVVWVEGFGRTSKRQIEKVHVSARGIFSYDIEGGFTVRHEDIKGLVGRRR